MRRTFLTSITVAVAMTFGMATSASAQCTNNEPKTGPFCIDGTITNANNSGVPTAASPPGPQALITGDLSGNSSELGPANGSNQQLNSIHLTGKLGNTSQPGKVDLNQVFTQAAVLGGDLWFYYAWIRDSTTGSGFMAIEFQQGEKPVACNYDTQTDAQLIAGCNPWANRQEGDFLILWDQDGGSTDVFIRHFTNGAFGSFDPVSGTLQKAVYGISDTSRGEMAINFSQLVGGGTSACLTFANIIPMTVTGNSDSADVKDTVLETFPLLSNCGIVTVQKVTVPANLAGDFSYTLGKSSAGNIFGVATADDECDAANVLTQCQNTLTGVTTIGTPPVPNPDNFDTIANLLGASDFTLVEHAVEDNFALTSIVCTTEGGTVYTLTAQAPNFTVEASKTTACVITNTLQTGKLRIIKKVVNAFGLSKVPGDFQFTLDGGALTYFTDTGAANGVSCVSEAVCREIEFNVGTSHDVLEPGGGQLQGYDVSYLDESGNAECNGLVISNSVIRTCTITNTATQATPAAVTRQRVLLFDKALVTGLRRLTSNEPAMSITFVVYGTAGSCEAATKDALGGLASEVVNLTLNQSDTSVTVGTTGDGTAGKPFVEIKLDDPAGLPGVTTVRYWRAFFQQAGASPPNLAFSTPCNEITTVNFVQ